MGATPFVQAYAMDVDDDVSQNAQASLSAPAATQRRPLHGGFPDPKGGRDWAASVGCTASGYHCFAASGRDLVNDGAGSDAAMSVSHVTEANHPQALKRAFAVLGGANPGFGAPDAFNWGSAVVSRPVLGLYGAAGDTNQASKRLCLGFPVTAGLVGADDRFGSKRSWTSAFPLG